MNNNSYTRMTVAKAKQEFGEFLEQALTKGVVLQHHFREIVQLRAETDIDCDLSQVEQFSAARAKEDFHKFLAATIERKVLITKDDKPLMIVDGQKTWQVLTAEIMKPAYKTTKEINKMLDTWETGRALNAYSGIEQNDEQFLESMRDLYSEEALVGDKIRDARRAQMKLQAKRENKPFMKLWKEYKNKVRLEVEEEAKESGMKLSEALKQARREGRI